MAHWCTGHVDQEALHGKGQERDALEVTQQGSAGCVVVRWEGRRAMTARSLAESRQPPWAQHVGLWEARAGAAGTCRSAQPTQRCACTQPWISPRCASSDPSMHQQMGMLEGTEALNCVSAVSTGQRLVVCSFSLVPRAVPTSNQGSFQ